MRVVFGDAAYWVALVNRRDQWHSRVLEVTQTLGPVNIVTTEEVLDEFLTHFSQHGPTLRSIAIWTVENAFQRPSVKVRPQSHETFLAGLDLFKRRSDKEYSLTDCISYGGNA